MSAIPLKKIVRNAVALAWDLLDELVSQVLFVKIITYDTDLVSGVAAQTVSVAPCDALKLYYSTHDFNGSSIIYGDEKWLVKGVDLAAITPKPSAGDWFEVAGYRWDIKAALLDPTGNLWTFQVRGQEFDATKTVSSSVDWGGLTAETSSEDWGDLDLFDSVEDLAI
jgi:hypothetical protein